MQRAMKAVHMKPFCTLPPSVCVGVGGCAHVYLYVTGTTNRFEEAVMNTMKGIRRKT